MEDLKEISEQLTQVRLDIRELTTEIRNLRDLNIKVEHVKEVAVRALDLSQSAHERLDNVDETLEKVKESQGWLPKLVTSSVVTTLVGGIVGAAIASSLGGG